MATEMTDWPRMDFHTHVSAHRGTGARADATVAGMVRRAEEVGLTHLGVGEHQNYQKKHPLSCIRDIGREFRALGPTAVQVFFGTEVDILDDQGSVTSDAKLKKDLGLDYHLAALHRYADIPVDTLQNHVAAVHRRFMAVTAKSDFVEVIAHPWSHRPALEAGGIPGGWPFGLIPGTLLEEWVEAMREHGKALELNTKTQKDFEDPGFLAFMAMVREAGVEVCVGSDSHAPGGLGTTFATDVFLQDQGFKAGQLWMPHRE